MIKDTTANIATIVSTGFAIADFETVLTIVVLFSALALNISRIYVLRKEK